MKTGDYVNTPRFLKVRIENIFESHSIAKENGYNEPTHYDSEEYDIHGKHIGTNQMLFSAIIKKQ